MAAPWAGQSSGIARSRARAARRRCGEVVGHRPQAADYLDSREQEGSDVTLCGADRPLKPWYLGYMHAWPSAEILTFFRRREAP